MDKIESASSNAKRKVIDVQQLERLPDSTPNPHLWYKPATMPLVAQALVGELSALAAQPRGLLQSQRRPVSTAACSRGCARCGDSPRAYPGTTVATTEPVADYMLQAAGIDNRTPFSMQAGDHERHRPGAAGGAASRTSCSHSTA